MAFHHHFLRTIIAVCGLRAIADTGNGNIHWSIQSLDSALKELYSLEEKLVKEKITVREVVSEFDEENPEQENEVHLQRVLTLIEKIHETDDQIQELKGALEAESLGSKKAKSIKNRIVRRKALILKYFREVLLNAKQNERIADKLRLFHFRIVAAEREWTKCVRKAKVPKRETEKALDEARRNPRAKKRVLTKAGLTSEQADQFDQVNSTS